MKKTPWFQMCTPPTRVGLYECIACNRLHLWDGKYWHVDEVKCRPYDSFVSSTRWRGLVKEAK